MTVRVVDLATIERSTAQDALQFITEELEVAGRRPPRLSAMALLLDETGLAVGAYGISPPVDGRPGVGRIVGTIDLFRRGYTVAPEAAC